MRKKKKRRRVIKKRSNGVKKNHFQLKANQTPSESLEALVAAMHGNFLEVLSQGATSPIRI